MTELSRAKKKVDLVPGDQARWVRERILEAKTSGVLSLSIFSPAQVDWLRQMDPTIKADQPLDAEQIEHLLGAFAGDPAAVQRLMHLMSKR